MAKKTKPNSFGRVHIKFHERLSHDHTSSCRCPLCKRRLITEDTIISVYDESIQRMVKKNDKRVIDNAKFLKHFKVSDFSLDALIASGAIANMRSCSLQGSRFDSVRNVDSFMNSLDKLNNNLNNE